MNKIKNWIKLHKKGLTIGVAFSIFISGITLGSVFKDTFVDLFAGGNTPETIATYCILGVAGLGFGVWLLIGLVTNRKGRKLRRKRDSLEIDQIQNKVKESQVLEKQLEALRILEKIDEDKKKGGE